MARAAKDPKTGVTPQQERFAAEFVKSGRPSIAYRRAYEAGGMKEDTIANNAYMLLQNSDIAARVEHYRKIALARIEVSVERIALETARIAFFDMREMVDDKGDPIQLQDLPEDTARALNGMDIEEKTAVVDGQRVVVAVVKKYKHVQKMDALRLLAQWKGMLIDRKETGKPGEFASLSDEEVEQQAKEAVAAAVKGGYLKLVKPGQKQKAA